MELSTGVLNPVADSNAVFNKVSMSLVLVDGIRAVCTSGAAALLSGSSAVFRALYGVPQLHPQQQSLLHRLAVNQTTELVGRNILLNGLTTPEIQTKKRILG